MGERIFAGESRRRFLRRASVVVAAMPVLPLFSAVGCSEANQATAQQQGEQSPPLPSAARVEPDCEWCGASDAPANLSWKTTVARAGEPGEPLIMSGRIYGPDGRTPAPNVLLYVYHTDREGFYRRNPSEHRHGRLRGWMRTDAEGRYEFSTIKAAPYPGGAEPAHIHVTLSGAGYPEYWIDTYWFEGDPFITAEKRARLSGRGGFTPIVSLKRDERGVLRGFRDIKLEHVRA